jgi:hypothetical protein
MMKLVGGVDAVCLAEAADLLVLGRALRLGVQEHLDGAGHTLAKLAPLVFNIALQWHILLLLLLRTADSLFQFSHRLRILLVVRCATVPVAFVLHETPPTDLPADRSRTDMTH